MDVKHLRCPNCGSNGIVETDADNNPEVKYTCTYCHTRFKLDPDEKLVMISGNTEVTITDNTHVHLSGPLIIDGGGSLVITGGGSLTIGGDDDGNSGEENKEE